MKKLLLSCQNPLIYRLILAVLLGGVGLSANADFDEGLAAYKKGDYATALREWQPLAEQGHARAQYNLGWMYAHGQGVPSDDEAAAQWYRRAAEQGYANAQFYLGNMYRKGEGVPQDYQAAAQWYRRAAEQEVAVAQYNLGLMYANGDGVLQDFKAAAQWYRRAAEQGITAAQYNLGGMYYEGIGGVPKDYVYAHMWVNIAASGGDEDAVELRNLVEEEMTPSQITEAQKLARECVRKAYRDC